MKTRLRHPHPVDPRDVKFFFFQDDEKGLVVFLKSHQKTLTPPQFTLLVEDAFLKACCHERIAFLEELLRDPVLSKEVSALSYDNDKMRPLELALLYGQRKTAIYLLEHEKFKGHLDLFFVGNSVVERIAGFFATPEFWAYKKDILKILSHVLGDKNFPMTPPSDTAMLFSLLFEEGEKELCKTLFQKSKNEEEVLRKMLIVAMNEEYHYSRQNPKTRKKKEEVLAAYEMASPDARASFFEKTKNFLEEDKSFYAPIFFDQSRQNLKDNLPKKKPSARAKKL